MTPNRLEDCLTVIRWSPDTLARALECDVSLVEAWLDDLEEIPAKTAAWIEVLALFHEKAELVRPIGLKGKKASGAQ